MSLDKDYLMTDINNSANCVKHFCHLVIIRRGSRVVLLKANDGNSP
jgi:hypothetical protein